MFIKKDDETTYTIKLNDVEYQVMKKLYNKLLFNPDGVSNYFKVTSQDVEIINHMRGYMHFVR